MGDRPQARRHLREALAYDPHYAPALLFEACLAMEAGDTLAAEVLLGRLHAAVPERPEPQLLQRMLAHRADASAASWRQDFLRAWEELNRPSFADSPLLPELTSRELSFIPPEAWARATSTQARLTQVLAMPTLSEERARWLVSQLPALDDAALIQAAAVKLLTKALPPSGRGEALAVVRQRLARLAEDSPGVLQPRLLLLWAEAPEWGTFSQAEMEALEAIAALPTWKNTSLTHTFLEAREHLKAAGVSYPGVRAFSLATASNNTWGVILLGQRAEVTRGQLLPGSRQRLGRMLWNIGSRLRQDSAVLVSNVGLQLMEEGARDMEDEAESERVAKALKEALATVAAAEQAALERWPLPSLWEEVAEARARDEWAHVRELAGAR
jgi:hypothetical protein